VLNKNKTLILVVRSESIEDFRSIAKRIRKIDPNMDIIIFGGEIFLHQMPSHFLNQPTLTMYLVNPPLITKPNDLAVKHLSKIDEYAHFKQHNIPCLPIEKFAWGMTLDESIYGDWVVIKPENINSSGKDINMIPTKAIPSLKLSDFPLDHLIHQDNYLVQKFIKTGQKSTQYRAGIFLDEVIYSRTFTSDIDYPKPGTDMPSLVKTSVASNVANRSVGRIIDETMNCLALEVAKTLPQLPLFGIDILKDEISGKLYVLEINAGGNIWHFSSLSARKKNVDRKALVLQYNAWDKCAEALIRKVNELAS
jgi:hypothetical protein